MADPYLDRLADSRCDCSYPVITPGPRCVFKMNHQGLHRAVANNQSVVWGDTARLTEEIELQCADGHSV